MTNPLVTIICVCYNQARFVTEALDSVIAQTYQPIELIVIDDGSTDGSTKVIKQWIALHPETMLVLNGTNIGYCKTFNKAAALAKGKYLIDLAADDIVLPNRVEVGVKALESTPQAGVTFSDAEHIDEAGIKISLHSDRFPHHTIPSGNIYAELIARFFICSPTMMFSRTMFNELGGYDETLMYEDFDFWIRSSRKYHYTYTSEVLVKKRKVTGSLSDKQFKVRSDQSLTTLRVCEKILELNETESERKALNSRLWYEMRVNLRLLNLKIAANFFILWLHNRKQLNSIDSISCPNCEEPLTGKFCSACGQKRIEPSERKLFYFFKQFFGAAFFLENSFIRNLWKLLTKPGLLATDYIEGRQKRWMPPFSIFFLINLIYFIVNPLTDFNLPLSNHIGYHATTYSKLAINMVESRMENRAISYEDYATIFNQETIGYCKSLMIFNVPVLALFLAIIFLKRKRFFVEHFIYALYFFSFLLLWACVWVGILNISKWLGMPHNQVLLPIGLALMIVIYLFVSMRKFYHVNWIVATGATLLMTALLWIDVVFYRFLMFIVTFAFT